MSVLDCLVQILIDFSHCGSYFTGSFHAYKSFIGCQTLWILLCWLLAILIFLQKVSSFTLESSLITWKQFIVCILLSRLLHRTRVHVSEGLVVPHYEGRTESVLPRLWSLRLYRPDGRSRHCSQPVQGPTAVPLALSESQCFPASAGLLTHSHARLSALPQSFPHGLTPLWHLCFVLWTPSVSQLSALSPQCSHLPTGISLLPESQPRLALQAVR